MKNNYFKPKVILFSLGLTTALTSCNEPNKALNPKKLKNYSSLNKKIISKNEIEEILIKLFGKHISKMIFEAKKEKEFFDLLSPPFKLDIVKVFDNLLGNGWKSNIISEFNKNHILRFINLWTSNNIKELKEYNDQYISMINSLNPEIIKKNRSSFKRKTSKIFFSFKKRRNISRKRKFYQA
jgi:hypothetical protein